MSMTTMAKPQHLAALEIANTVRLKRAMAKQRVRQGESPAGVILDPADELAGMRVV
jgi:hypothetical protein